MGATRRSTAPGGQTTRLQRESAFVVLALFTLGALLVLFSGCGTAGSATSTVTAPAAQAQPVRQVRMHLVPSPTILTIVRTARRHLYTFARSNVGLMQPAVDSQGNVWVGEMHANRLGCLNARTGAVTSWTPPGAEYGIMTTIVDAAGNAWFAEQNANYIGRFDGRGRLWFAAEEGGAIGQLDPGTGTIRLWPLPSPTPGVPANPDTLIVTPHGQVWFGDFAGGVLGNLDPATGRITLYRLPDPQVQVFRVAADSAGRIWFTEVLPGKLGMFDPATGTLTELPMPALAGDHPALYELAIDRQNTIWFVDVGANTLIQYVPAKRTLAFFQLSLPSSAPFGLTLDHAGNVWFTAGGSSANYVGELTS